MTAEAMKANTRSESGSALAGLDSSLGARVRVALAAVLRLAERLAEGMVGAYERLFCLDARDTAEIYMNVGSDLARTGRVDDALAALRRTLAIEPRNGMAWLQLGMVHLRQKESPAALGALQGARSCGVESFELHYLMAEAFSDLERHAEAAEELRLALALDPAHAEGWYRLGTALDRLARYEEAIAAFRRAIEQAPREVSYQQSLGFTLESLGRRDEAIDCFKRALELERRARS